MADAAETAEKASKLPFATYDIIVYFGAGAFTLPLLGRYGRPFFKEKMPLIFDSYSDETTSRVISAVSIIFIIYVIGHGIAFLSSIFIERFVFRTAGPPSLHIAQRAAKDSLSFNLIIKQVSYSSYLINPTAADVFRLMLHLPVLPLYLVMYILGFHGFYETKLSKFVVRKSMARLSTLVGYNFNNTFDMNWFKITEYTCANEYPRAMAKMYNYLSIYGLFRSISLIMLICTWLEIIYWWALIPNGFTDPKHYGNPILRIMVLQCFYFTSLAGFCKFSRRYAEDAVQALTLSKPFG